MKANQTRISLETAKIIKPIAKPSKKYFCDFGKLGVDILNHASNRLQKLRYINTKIFPAYSWQEILWEYPKEFFGEEIEDFSITQEGGIVALPKYKGHTAIILNHLREKNIEKADRYFREECIFSKK